MITSRTRAEVQRLCCSPSRALNRGNLVFNLFILSHFGHQFQSISSPEPQIHANDEPKREWRAARHLELKQTEGDLDANLFFDGLAVLEGGTELPTADRFNRLFIEAVSHSFHHLNVTGRSIDRNRQR